jgi:hypothetical protein
MNRRGFLNGLLVSGAVVAAPKLADEKLVDQHRVGSFSELINDRAYPIYDITTDTMATWVDAIKADIDAILYDT